MRVLVLGADGMLGHKVFQCLRGSLDVFGTLRGDSSLEKHSVFAGLESWRIRSGVDAFDFNGIAEVIEEIQPQSVVNCIGIVKQRDEAKVVVPSIQINALFPHQLADYCGARGIRVVHLSTDCVFSGRKGNYSEGDIPDPVDFYGRSKLLGELEGPGCLTLRTSMIGWELKNRKGLLEWFASKRGQTIQGYCGAVFTGVTTAVLAKLIGKLLLHWPLLSGIYHITANPINKYDLLIRLRDALNWQDITVEPDEHFKCDRSLKGNKFESAVGWRAPGWDEMIKELASERSLYEKWGDKV